jgi:hypothetical protein
MGGLPRCRSFGAFSSWSSGSPEERQVGSIPKGSIIQEGGGVEEKYDAINWMREFLKIRHQDTGELVPFNLNLAQRKVWNVMQLQASAGLPVRLIIVKARQEGVSTLIEGILFQYINRYANKLAQVVSADTDSTNLVFNMSKIFQSELPADVRKKTDYSNRKEIAYSAPHRSKLMVQTAGKDVLGRGGTVQYFHASEVAFWPNAKEGLGGALQQVHKVPGTLVALESTGNGVGGEFYDRYIEAVDRIRTNPNDYSNYLPIFLAWHTFPSYTLKIPKGVVVDPDEEERDLQKKYHLTLEQIFWRRNTISGECGGDLRMFKQEYPADWEEAFQSTGQSIFSQAMLNKWQTQCKQGRNVVFEPGGYQDVLRRQNCWTVWRLPQEGHQYSMGIDTAEGKVSDSGNERSDPDYHGVVIYDRTSNEVVAIYHGREEQHLVGKQCLWAAQLYNGAWVAPELPYGMVVLDIFKQAGYVNIFNREGQDDAWDVKETNSLGWKTTVATRPVMVEQLVKLCHEDPPKVYSSELVKEMRTFVRNKTGKAIHLPGEHDDILFGLMIAVQIHLRCPMNLVPYEYASTGDDVERSPMTDICYSGAIDTLADMLGMDEDDFYE